MGSDEGERIEIYGVSDKLMFCKLMLPNSIAGSLIGKGGTKIQNIRKKSGAKLQISVPTNTNPQLSNLERLVVVQGGSNQVNIALHLLLDIIASPGVEGGESSGSPNSSMYMNDGQSQNQHDISIRAIIADSTIPILLGKGGSRIKQIRSESSAKVIVSTDLAYTQLLTSQERIVTITGCVDVVKDALIRIINIAQEDILLPNIMNFKA